MPSKSNDNLLHQIETFARARCREHDQAHDALHLTRVITNARRLIEAEAAAGRNVDSFVVEAACWLHDVVQLPKGAGPPGESARQSACEAAGFLADLGLDEQTVAAITHAIKVHSYSGGLRPQTIEAAIVQDADRLDALGAVGIARLWIVAATTPGMFYDELDPKADSRRLDDRRFDLDHISVKLLKLPSTMNTDTGRRIAQQRADFAKTYRDTFLAEIGYQE